jgi:phosphotriesterase-related protein
MEMETFMSDEMVGRTNTVLGPVDASELGIVLPHEHLLSSWANWLMPPWNDELRAVVDQPVSVENLRFVRRNPHSFLDNLTFSDVEEQTRELALLARAGGRTVVELTPASSARDPEGYAQISRATGVNVICSTGWYLQGAHPPLVRERAIEELTEIMVRELVEGIEGTEIKAGMIGEIGTSNPIHPDEEKVLRAAVHAQRQTGAPLTVHVDGFGRQGHRVLDIVNEEGGDPTRVVICHLDISPDRIDYHISLADRGAYVSYDTFGIEWGNDDRRAFEQANWFIPPTPSDMERVRAVKRMVDAGYAERLVLSQDVSVKQHLTRLGGYGYAHLLENIVPLMLAYGVGEDAVTTMLERNNATLLGWAPVR